MPKRKHTQKNQTFRDLILNTIMFPYYHPYISAFGLLLIGGILNPLLSTSNNNAKYNTDIYKPIYGDANALDTRFILFLANHSRDDETWKHIKTMYDQTEIEAVLVEGKPKGLKIDCKHSIANSSKLPPEFKPQCIGADTDKNEYYQRNYNEVATDTTTLFLESLKKESETLSREQFSSYLKNIRKNMEDDSRAFEKQYHFTQTNVQDAVTFTREEEAYRLLSYMLTEIKNMQQYLAQGKDVKEIFATYTLRFSEPNYYKDENRRKPSHYPEEMLARNKALMETVADLSKTGKKYCVLFGKNNALNNDEDASNAAVTFFWNSIKDPKMHNRFAVLAMIDEPEEENVINSKMNRI